MTTRDRRTELLASDPRIARLKLVRKARAIREKARRRALNSFEDFCVQAIAAAVVGGIDKLDRAPHVTAICNEIQAMLEGWLVAYGRATPAQIARTDAHWKRHDVTRLEGELLVQNWIGNLPPGTLKSTIILVLANAWMWLHDPTFKFGAASGNDKNVERDSLATRDIVTSAWYRDTFGIAWTIRRDADSIGKWANTEGGERLSRTIGAGFTGLHLDGMFVDDPDDADKVWNEPERKRVQGRWTRAMENRVNDERRTIRLVLQQRVHVDDLTGYLLRKSRWSPMTRKGWAQFSISMEFGAGPKDAPVETPFGTRDWRAEFGEVMHAVRFPPDVLADKRVNLGTNGYNCQYNQNPQAEDAGMISRKWVRFFVWEGTDVASLRARPDGCLPRLELPPRVLQLGDPGQAPPELRDLSISIDCSNGSESEAASANGILAIGRIGEDKFWIDDKTAVLGIHEMFARVKAIIVAWRAPRVLIELKAAGSSLVAELRKELGAGNIRDAAGNAITVVVEVVTDVRDSKVGRARAMVPGWEAGHWYVLDGAPWLYESKTDDGAIAEVCSFPKSKKNDRIDCLSQYDKKYRTVYRPKPQGGYLGGAASSAA